MKPFAALAAIVTSLHLYTAAASAADPALAWPRFRGPNGAGIAADDARPPVEFGPDKNLKWKVGVPGGLSSPIIVGDLLVLTAFDEGKLYTIAYRRDDGREAWRAEAPAKQLEMFHKIEGSPATSTPATDGKRIVSYFGSCGLFCYDLAGREQWKFELPPAKMAGDFGSGVSPILVDGLVVLLRDETQNPRILAIEAATGTLKWETNRRSVLSYGTPVVWDTPAGRQIAAPGHARLVGYDLATGAERWSSGGLPAGTCSSPVVANGVLYFAGSSTGGDGEDAIRPTFDSLLEKLDADKDGALSRAEAEQAFMGFFDNQDMNKDGKFTRDEHEFIDEFFNEGTNSAFALKPGGSGDVTASHVVWKQSKGLPYLTSALVYRGQCFLVKDGGIVTAYDARTGKQAYQTRAAADKYYASPVAAGGNVYFTSMDGAVTVLKAGEAKAEVVAKNPKLGERTVATPAIAGDTFYLRTEGHLYAFREKQ
jgi:outer membrane protein assembly factor BamB